MNRIEYLADQAARADRLARAINDTTASERLRSYAAECRAEVERLKLETRPAAA